MPPNARTNYDMREKMKKERPEYDQFFDNMNVCAGSFWVDRENYGKSIMWVNSAMNMILPQMHPSKTFPFLSKEFTIIERVKPPDSN